MPDPVTLITAELISRLEEPNFRPFSIMLSDGSVHDVPTRDHCTITRLLRRIEVERDNGRVVQINPLHITRIEAIDRKPAA